MPPLMLFHVTLGTLAVIAGAAAMVARKGEPTHRLAGTVFFATMLGTSAAGALVAWGLPGQLITFHAGLLACYLVATSWMTVRRPERRAGMSEIAACLAALAIGVSLALLGARLEPGPAGANGFAPEDYFFLAAIALIAAALDLRFILRGGLAGGHRIARHLWRMCFAFFMAAGSLFTGPGADVFPQAIRETGLLVLPELLIGLAMAYYLVRVLATKWRQGSKTGPVTRRERAGEGS